MFPYIKRHWGKIILASILLLIIILNFKPGYYILGNDNYSPELNPKLSLERSLLSPSWRSYRVLGLPSDSEQADVFRSFAYYILNFVIPGWLLSQGYIFFCLITGSLSIAFLCSGMLSDKAERHKKELMILLSGLIYLCNLLTVWFFNSPLNVFLAGYAFLPLVLWRIHKIFRNNNLSNFLFLIISLGFFSTSSMVATTFIVELGLIVLFIIFLITTKSLYPNKLVSFLHGFLIFLFVISSQLFWIMPFMSFVKSNSKALQDSYINRVLTPELVENEVVYNQPQNVTRFLFSWIDGKNNNGTYQFPYRSWYKDNILAIVISYIPLLLAFIGVFYILQYKKYSYLFFPVTLFTGWLLIKGTNPPLGFVFQFFQNSIPLFKQVFRWQSSKIFPFILIPLCFLSALGAAYIVEKIENSHHWKKYRTFRFIFILSIILTGLIYIFPTFSGNLIGGKYYVKVPDDYFLLRDYLEINNIKDRIYLAPEANTLYFRNYSWEFFGSSFMNYLIPNPIIEKALTTGSYENENAQNIMENAYYSENPQTFINALKLFKTPLILLDKYADKAENGYDYDWSLAQKLIESNPQMDKIWEKGQLSLYKIKYSSSTSDYHEIYSGHNWKQLNTIYALDPGINNNYSVTNGSGDIFPFALNYDKISDNGTSIVTESIYKGKEDQYAVDPPQSSSSPSKILIDKINGILKVYPSNPAININNSPLQFSYPFLSATIKDPTGIITVDGQLIELSNNQVTVETPYTLIKDRITEWSPVSTDYILSKSNQDKYTFRVNSDSMVKLEISLKTDKDISLSVCVYSLFQRKCLNRNNTYYLHPGGPQTLELTVPEIVNSFDTIEVYISALNDLKGYSIDLVKAKVYSNSSAINLKESLPSSDFPRFITLHPGDRIGLEIPKIYGYDDYHFDGGNSLIADVTHGDCNRQNTDYFLKKEGSSSLNFNSKDCYNQSLVNLERISPAGLAMIYYKGENSSGIPLQISIRNKKESNKLFEDRLNYKADTNKFGYFRLPADIRSYLLELYSYGFGPNPSINSLEKLSFQFIPSDWYTLRLRQVNNNPVNILTINEAFHYNWESKESTQPVRVNGWEQGWISRNNDTLTYEFKENKKAYLGVAIFTACSLLWLTGLFVHKIRSRKSSLQKHP